MIEIDPKIKKIILIVLCSFVVLIVFLMLIKGCNNKYTPKKFETYIVEKTKGYYSNHKEALPKINMELSLSLDDLVNKGIIKELDKVFDKDTTCSGSIIIENNNDNFMYSPNLNCKYLDETYKTEKLKDVLLSNVVTSGNGLYNIGTNYYYRGDNVNNYIIFDGVMFRITKINDDGTIRLIEYNKRENVYWDDRFNEERSSSTGKNMYQFDNINSRIKDSLDELYKNNTLISNDAKGFVKPYNLCTGKRSLEETINDGTIECSNILENQYFGLIQMNEYLLASLDSSCVKAQDYGCQNYNYLSEFSGFYWSITAVADNTYQVYKLNDSVIVTNASSMAADKVVLNISSNTNVTGKGTEKDPYIVSGLKTTLNEKK